MKKFILSILLMVSILGCAIFFTSCGDNKKDDNGGGNITTPNDDDDWTDFH